MYCLNYTTCWHVIARLSVTDWWWLGILVSVERAKSKHYYICEVACKNINNHSVQHTSVLHVHRLLCIWVWFAHVFCNTHCSLLDHGIHICDHHVINSLHMYIWIMNLNRSIACLLLRDPEYGHGRTIIGPLVDFRTINMTCTSFCLWLCMNIQNEYTFICNIPIWNISGSFPSLNPLLMFNPLWDKKEVVSFDLTVILPFAFISVSQFIFWLSSLFCLDSSATRRLRLPDTKFSVWCSSVICRAAMLRETYLICGLSWTDTLYLPDL